MGLLLESKCYVDIMEEVEFEWENKSAVCKFGIPLYHINSYSNFKDIKNRRTIYLKPYIISLNAVYSKKKNSF